VEEELAEERETRGAWESELKKERVQSQHWRLKVDNVSSQVTRVRDTLKESQQQKKAALVRGEREREREGGDLMGEAWKSWERRWKKNTNFSY